MQAVIDITNPDDPRVDDFRDLNSVDRRPDLPTGKGLVIAEGVLVVRRMLTSRFAPHAMLGTDRRLAELADDLSAVAPYLDLTCYRATAEVMADVVGFHLNRGVLAAARRPVELSVSEVLERARTIAVLASTTGEAASPGETARSPAISCRGPESPGRLQPPERNLPAMKSSAQLSSRQFFR